MTTDPRGPVPTSTLARLIYAGGGVARVPELHWVQLVQSTAAANLAALDALYERAAAPVFTLIARMLNDRTAAAELTVDVFLETWRRASRFDPRTGPVIGWIMNMARSRASARLWLERRGLPAESAKEAASPGADAAAQDSHVQQERALRTALSMLTAEERLTIETAIFPGVPQGDIPLGTARAQIRSALGKLTLVLERTERLTSPTARCERMEALYELVLHAMLPHEAAATEVHVAGCAQCRREVEELRRVVDALQAWGTDLLRPPSEVRAQLARRVPTDELGSRADLPVPPAQPEPPWTQVAPGIQVKTLAADHATDRVSLLLRLAPGFAYPSHRHADVEELYLLDGELWIDGRRLVPGDYNRAEPGTSDHLVWSGTGCSCVLTTSVNDVLH